jgi:hypothetical protein
MRIHISRIYPKDTARLLGRADPLDIRCVPWLLFRWLGRDRDGSILSGGDNLDLRTFLLPELLVCLREQSIGALSTLLHAFAARASAQWRRGVVDSAT